MCNERFKGSKKWRKRFRLENSAIIAKKTENTLKGK